MTTRSSLRILQLCPFFYPVLGGLERVVLHLSAAMVRRGHRVTVFTSDLSRDGRIGERFGWIHGVQIVRFPTWFKIGSFASFWPGFCPALRKQDFDIVHAHSYRHPHCDLASLPMLRDGAKFVLQPHWPGHPRGVVGSALTRLYDGAAGRRLLQSSDLVFALTPAEVPWLQARGARAVRVLPNGVPAKFLEEPSGQTTAPHRGGGESLSLISVGRIDRMKGFQYVIEALRRVQDVHYVIAGPPGDFFPHLVGMIREAGLKDRVTFAGMLTEDEVLSALDASDAFIQPSVFEASPVATLEALARGKPCAGSRAGGLSWLLDDCGLLFNPGDVDGITDCVRRLRDDRELRERLAAAGRVKASALTWEQIVPLYEEALFELAPQCA